MGKDRFEFARITSPEEIAEYLSSLAVGLKRGEVTLESDSRSLRLLPPADVKLEIKAKQKEQEGKIKLEIGWKRRDGSKASDLRVEVRKRPERS